MKNKNKCKLLIALITLNIFLQIEFVLGGTSKQVVNDGLNDIHRFTEKEIENIVDSITDFENLTIEKANELYRKIEKNIDLSNVVSKPSEIDLTNVFYQDSMLNFQFNGKIEKIESEIYVNIMYWTAYSLSMVGILDTWTIHYDIIDDDTREIDEIDNYIIRVKENSEIQNEHYLKGIAFYQDNSDDKYVYIDLFTNEISYIQILLIVFLVLIIFTLALVIYQIIKKR